MEGGRGMGNYSLMGTVSVSERVLKMDGGDGYTMMRMHVMPLKYTSEMENVVKNMPCIFYHNSKF